MGLSEEQSQDLTIGITALYFVVTSHHTIAH